MATPNMDFQITFAMDISGSTVGPPIRAETGVIEQLAAGWRHLKEGAMTVLSWNNKNHTAISFPKEMVVLKYLEGRGGTSPSCLYSNSSYLTALKSCALWVLMTDGLIGKNEVHNFTKVTTQNAMHGKACVMIVIFGNIDSAPPAVAEISVGIAAYALAANSILLFHDIPTGKLYLLQAKGCFKALLGEYEQLLLGRYLRWADLPQVTYAELASVEIPDPQALAEDEITMEDGLVIRLKDVYAGTVSADLHDRVSNSVHLRSIVGVELSRGNREQLKTYLRSQKKDMPQKPVAREDIGGKAKTALKNLQCLKDKGTSEDIEKHRTELRTAHDVITACLRSVLQEYERRFQEVSTANQSYDMATEQVHLFEKCKTSYSKGLSKTSASASVSLGYKGETRRSGKQQKIDHPQPDLNDIKNTSGGQTAALSNLNECFLPGFKRNGPASRAGAELTGKCMLCHRESILTLLFKALPGNTFAPQGLATPFPSKIHSNTAVSDILSSTICCDACASYIVAFNSAEAKSSTVSEVTTAIGSVSAAENLAAWTEALDRVCMGSVRIQGLSSLFATIMKRGENETSITEINKEFRKAVKWFGEELEKVTTGQNSAEGGQNMTEITDDFFTV